MVDDVILGKPRDREDSINMLLKLAGRFHRVLTGICVSDGSKTCVLSVEARVEFKSINHEEACAYAATGEGADKAGGYGIQGIGGIFAKTMCW